MFEEADIQSEAAENEFNARLEAFKNKTGVEHLLVFEETEWREDQPGYKSSQTGSSFFFIAIAEDALYILHEPAEMPHPFFSTPLKRIEYKNCKIARGGGDKGFDTFFFIGNMVARVLKGAASNAVCRLLIPEGELLMTGTKENVSKLENKITKQ